MGGDRMHGISKARLVDTTNWRDAGTKAATCRHAAMTKNAIKRVRFDIRIYLLGNGCEQNVINQWRNRNDRRVEWNL